MRIAQLKIEIMKMSKQTELRRTGANSNMRRFPCNTCPRPTDGKEICPGKKVECYICRLTRHFKGITVCKELAKDKVKTGKGRANQINGWGEESDTRDKTE